MSTLRRAQGTLAHVLTAPSSFYRDFYARVIPDRFNDLLHGTMQWNDVPPLTRNDIARIPYSHRLFRSFSAIDAIRPTSGTSGAGILLMPRLAFDARVDTTLFTGVKREAGFERIASMSGAQFLFAESSFREMGASSIAIDPGDPTTSSALIQAFEPDTIAGPCHAIVALAPYLPTSTRERIRAILLFGEWSSRGERRVVQNLFPQAVVLIDYASIDLQLSAAITCMHEARRGSGILHVLTDFVHVEIMPLPDQTEDQGELVVTTLWDAAFPLVRYRTGDRARRIPGKCPCGLETPRITVEGRIMYDRIRIAGGEIVLAEVERALGDRITNFEVVVRGEGTSLRIVLRVPSGEEHEGLVEKFSKEFRLSPTLTYAAAVQEGKCAPMEFEPLPHTVGKRRRITRELYLD